MGAETIIDTDAGGCQAGLKQYTPVAFFKKKDIVKATITMLRKRTTGKAPKVQEQKHRFVIYAGDQGAESAFPHIKSTMRRVGNIGRFHTKKPFRKCVEALASAALLRKPGFDMVMDAMAAYRQAGMGGTLRLAPEDNYDMSKIWWVHKAK